MMRPILVGNWKMYGTGACLPVIGAITRAAERHPTVEVAMCLPATLLDRARSAAPTLGLGGQDCHPDDEGAHTGDLSAAMLGDAGATLALLGHSERRRDHGEGDALIAAKLRAARRAGLRVLLCVGETAEDHAAGRSAAVVRAQLTGALAEADGRGIAIAYEPIWAIGTDHIPTPAQVADMARQIRDTLATVTTAPIPVLYGGSVNPENVGALFADGGIDGFLVGRQSLDPAAFTAILESMAAA